ncbi:MAG TPA: DUF4344 domain-containing metallopeptidase [Thermoanaerobaculia bacterium]|nr:DUF4344 domain-containing metallopeptidase [Thermoanaerobaculia bacterium]
MNPIESRSRRQAIGPWLAVLFFSVVFSGCGVSGSSEPATPAGQVASATTSDADSANSAKGPRRHISRSGRAAAERGHLRFSYAKVKNPDYKELQKVFHDERFFEDVVDDLDKTLVLPRNLEVKLQECGEVNAFYDPEDGAVHLCYEMVEHFLQVFTPEDAKNDDAENEEVGGKAIAAMVFVFYHELGHALIDIYDLPVTGREEDAVDQLATVMLLETWDGEESELAMTASAEWFDSSAAEREEDPDMADEHALDEQRYYNLLCWTYGSDPDYFADQLEDWELPEERAERCPEEYQRMSRSWDTLLGPHMVEVAEEEAPAS